MCAQGHDVVFSETNGNYILLNGSTDDVIPLRTVGGTYEIDVWIRPVESGGPSLAGVARACLQQMARKLEKATKNLKTVVIRSVDGWREETTAAYSSRSVLYCHRL